MLETVVSYLVTVLLLFQQLFGVAFPTNPYQFFSDRFKLSIVQEPVVFDCGDCYAVMWVTNYRSTGYVTYTYNGEELTATDADGGILRSDDTIHSVEIPKEHLDGNTYTVHSEFVLMNLAYIAIKGETVSGKPTHFRGYDGRDSIKMLVLTDVHGLIDDAVKASSYFEEKPDIVALTGDISGELLTKNDFVGKVLKTAYVSSKGEIPVFYVRGNHETRGEFSPNMGDYFPTPTGEFYFTTSYGPISMLVVDSGEDKDDGHDEYSGLVNFDAYRKKEYKWLNSLAPVEAEYRITLCHFPYLDDHFGMDWRAPVAAFGTQLLIGGHYHTLKLDEVEPYDVFIAGGKNKDTGYVASTVTFSDGKAHIESFNVSGDKLIDKSITL